MNLATTLFLAQQLVPRDGTLGDRLEALFLLGGAMAFVFLLGVIFSARGQPLPPPLPPPTFAPFEPETNLAHPSQVVQQPLNSPPSGAAPPMQPNMTIFIDKMTINIIQPEDQRVQSRWIPNQPRFPGDSA